MTEPVNLVENKVENKVEGNAENLVQVGIATFLQEHDGPLLARYVGENDVARVRDEFVSPGEFDRATRIVTEHCVVVLRGTGSGRDFAGQRLLVDRHCARIGYLNGQRTLGSVRRDDLRAGHGYVWNLSDQGVRPFGDVEFEHVAGLVTTTPGCHLVIVLGEGSLTPPAAMPYCVELKPPDATLVARRVISRERVESSDPDPMSVLEKLSDLLPTGTSPERAVQAGELAVRVAGEGLPVGEAMAEFSNGFDHEVTARMDSSWSTMEYTMMLAVAVMQDRPFEEVVRRQRDLDERIRKAELPKDKELRPRRAFIKPNDQLLHVIGALTEERDNPIYEGEHELAVRFRRRGWAEPVLCRIWQHYHAEHDLLLDWMCTADVAAAVHAVHTIVTRVPTRGRTRELDHLVRGGVFGDWRIASATLARLADDEQFADLVRDMIEKWSESERAAARCAAIVYHHDRFEQVGQAEALRRMAAVGRDPRQWVHDTLVSTVLLLLCRRDWFDQVLAVVASWADDWQARPERDGLRPAALDIGMYLFRMKPEPRADRLGLDPVTVLAAGHPRECRRLLTAILADPGRRRAALSTLDRIGDWHPSLRDDRVTARVAGVRALIALLAPDLHWWPRHRATVRICWGRNSERPFVRRMLRAARRMERTG